MTGSPSIAAEGLYSRSLEEWHSFGSLNRPHRTLSEYKPGTTMMHGGWIGRMAWLFGIVALITFGFGADEAVAQRSARGGRGRTTGAEHRSRVGKRHSERTAQQKRRRGRVVKQGGHAKQKRHTKQKQRRHIKVRNHRRSWGKKQRGRGVRLHSRGRRNHTAAPRRKTQRRQHRQHRSHRRGSISVRGHRAKGRSVRGGIHVDIDIAWPWPRRHRRSWRPRYQYRQAITVRAGWGHHRHREARIDVRTRYRQRVRSASPHRAVVDIVIEAIELYADGQYLGRVDRIPRRLSHVRATIYRGGGVTYERDLFLVGAPEVGFELIATRHYDRYVLDAYRSGHDIEVGVLDLQYGEVVPVRRSRLFHPARFEGFVPISLLPEDPTWRYDYGHGAISARYRGDGYQTYRRPCKRRYTARSGIRIALSGSVELRRLR